MKAVTVKKRIPSMNIEASTDYLYPETIAEAKEVFGEDVCVGLIEDQLTLRIQAKLGSLMVDSKGNLTDKTKEEIQTAFDEWKPGVAPARGSGKKSLVNSLAKLIKAGKKEEVEALLKAAKEAAEAETDEEV